MKKEFEIDVHEEIIVQKFDNEWQEYVDIDDLEGVEDRFNRPYAKMAAVNFCHREELFVNRNILLHCKDQVKRNHCMKF